VLIVDAATGKYIGHFGAYGQDPVVGEHGGDDGEVVGSWAGDFRKGALKPSFFLSPLHCAKFANDGLLYACDRGNNRVQVFRASEVGKPYTDAKQTCLYVADLTNDTIYVVNCQTLQELSRIGTGGRQAGNLHWPHVVGTDTEGNLYRPAR
jgi:YVTN family beta-propeller protein